MLKKFDRYLLRLIALTTGGALVFLLTIDLLVQLSGDFNDSQPLALIFQLLLWQLPDKIILFLPASLLLGAILALGALARSNELTVVLAAGVSRFRLTRPALLFALLLGFAGLGLGEIINNTASGAYERLLNKMGTNGQKSLWLRDQNYLVNIHGFNGDGSLAQLELYRYDEQQLQLRRAASASYRNDHWQLRQVQLYTIDQEHITLQSSATERWPNPISPRQIQQLAKDHRLNSLGKLINLARFMEANGLSHREIDLQIYQKLLLPINSLIMILLALPFVFGNQRNSAQGTRLVFGIILGTSYYLAQSMLANLALLLNLWPLLALLLPNLFFAAVALLILRRG